jgi:hypothetical protein
VQPIVIAGAGPLAAGLAERLGAKGLPARLVSTTTTVGWRADLTHLAEAEVACAGARTLVVLAATRRAPTKRSPTACADLDRLLADSLARAARGCGVTHVVLYACGDDDPREALLRASGVPVSVLRGGGPDPLPLLESLIHRGPGDDLITERWSSVGSSSRGSALVGSVQRYRCPPGWSAERLAQRYFAWLPGQVPTVRVETSGPTCAIWAFGTRVLVLLHQPGRSEDGCSTWGLADGALVGERPLDARFEFRVLLGGTEAMTSFIGFEPRLPWPVHQLTQALLHQRVMTRFAALLGAEATGGVSLAPALK